VSVTVGPLSHWFHDLCSCLHDCLGTILLHNGRDPVQVMGASWEFFHAPEDVRCEEFYHPAPRPTLGESMMPFHPVSTAWHASEDAESAWAAMRDVVSAGRPVIAAVDNFHMPIRPAFGDVHAAHLMVVSGFDDDRGEVHVLESTPPTYHGPVPLRDFLLARSSTNEARPDTRDYFFAGTEIRNRWLEVTVDGPDPAPTREWVARVVATNVEGFRAPAQARGRAGLAGLAGYLHDICERAGGTDGRAALDELYTVGWQMQAATALHADFLRAAGRALGWDELVEAGRHVDRLANDWTPLRILGAHGGARGIDVHARLRRRVPLFVADHERTLERMEWMLRDAGLATVRPLPRGTA
jgi:Butirosin biosynthesis protein H, N-terminal